MIFFSYEFVIFFLLVLGIRAFFPHAVTLIVLSVGFYVFFGSFVGLCVLLGLALVGTYLSPILAIIVSATVLLIFKYTNFFAELVIGNNQVLDMPFILGLSFFAFEIIQYSAQKLSNSKFDTSRTTFFNFVTFFPTMIAGPIKRIEGFKFKKFSDSQKLRLLLMLLLGILLKYLADNISGWIDILGGLYFHSPRLSDKAILILALGFRIYFDFSGFSMIAIALAGFLGYEVPANFRNPYVATNLIDFWRRWHISLSTWIRDYLYIPLGGSNKKFRNILIAMTICGLWHGAGLNFVIWGLVHGCGLCINHYFRGKNFKVPLTGLWGGCISFILSVASWFITQAFVFCLWVPFFYSIDQTLNFFGLGP